MYVSYHPLQYILYTALHLTFIYETHQFIKDKVRKVTFIQNRHSVDCSCCFMSSMPRFCCDCSLYHRCRINNSHHCTMAVPATRVFRLTPAQALCICSSTAWNHLIIPGISHTAHCLVLLIPVPVSPLQGSPLSARSPAAPPL